MPIFDYNAAGTEVLGNLTHPSSFLFNEVTNSTASYSFNNCVLSGTNTDSSCNEGMAYPDTGRLDISSSNVLSASRNVTGGYSESACVKCSFTMSGVPQ